MGGVVGGATAAAMAAIVMIFEMTLDYTVILPLTLTVAISYGVRRSLIKDSIYTRKLTLRGESVPETLRADIPLSRRAADVMQPLSPEMPQQWNGDGANAARKDYVLVAEDASLWEVIAKMRASGASAALVVPRLVASHDGEPEAVRVRGMISRKNLLDTLADDMELFGH